MAGLLVVLIAGLFVGQPSPGTMLLLASGRSPDHLEASSVSVHSSRGWRNLGDVRRVDVPAAPATATVLNVALPAGRYDQLRVGKQAVALDLEIRAQEVEPVLLTAVQGRLDAAGVYAGNDEVNLGLSELAGHLTPMAPFQLQDQIKRPFSNAEMAGHEVVIAAFHTSCHEACPIYTGLFLQLRRQLPRSTMLVEATTDPEHDTPEVLRAYASRVGADWTFLTSAGDPAEMQRFWEPFKVDLSAGDTHVSTLAVLDRHGYVRLVYRGVPAVGELPGVLRDQLNEEGHAALARGGEGWGSPQVVEAVQTVRGLSGRSDPGDGRAPDFTLRSLDGGPSISLEHFRGRPLVINFWASWCPACATEMPLLQSSLARRPGISLLLVDYRDDEKAARSFLARNRVQGQVAADPDGTVGDLYKVRGLPVTVFVRADGSLEGTYFGELDERILAAHLASIEGG